MIARQERWYWTNPAKPKLHTQLKPHLAHVFAFLTPSHLSLTSTFLIWWDMNNLTAKRVSTWQASASDSFTRFTRGIKVSGAPKQVSRSVCLFPEIKTLSMGPSTRPALTQFLPGIQQEVKKGIDASSLGMILQISQSTQEKRREKK